MNDVIRASRSLFRNYLLALMATGAGSTLALADAPATPAGADKPASAEEPKKPKPDFPPFEEVSEGHEKIPGFIDLYYDKKKDHLLAAIPASSIGKEFLIASSISGGPLFTGFMWDDALVKWEERDDKLVLIAPDLRYDPASQSTMKDVIERTYTDRIVLATKIVSKRGADPVIDLDDVFKSDRVGLAQFYHGKMDSKLSKWAETKGFEKNVELAVDAAVMSRSPGGDEGGTRARVHFSISELPKTDYKPRRADDRVGYFMTAIKDYGRDYTDKTIFDRLIHRWHLRKADPKQAVSDVCADDQIVFYIEKTVPVQFRRYVREGILMWNKAFEKAGLRNAMAVRQQTDTNEFKDLDPEDVRYNFFRWIVSGQAFAMGPSRVNPRTGQVLDADIVWDDSLTRSLLAQYARMIAKGPATSFDPQLDEFLTLHPEWAYVPIEQRLLPQTAHFGGANLAFEPEQLALLGQHRDSMCTLAYGIKHEMALADFVLRDRGMEGMTQEFVGNFIRYVVAHEVGHTLGLRHNFKGSSWKTIDELLAAKDSGEPTSGSVMDYNAAVFSESADQQPNFFTPALGPYDYWAIEYGYRLPDDEFKSEEELLTKVASHGNEPGLAYATDEDTGFFAPDPTVNRWDNGSDPVAYAAQRMKVIKKLQDDITDWAVDDGESYSHLRRAFDALLFEYGRVASFATRVIGGQYIHRNHKGDPNEQPAFEVVPLEAQQQAFEFIQKNALSDKAFQFSPELINKLAAGRWGHWDSDDFDQPREYPLHDRIAATQYTMLFYLLSPFTINRIYDAELKVPADRMTVTVPDVIKVTTETVWSELTDGPGSDHYTNRKPYISSIRRTLQRNQLRLMIDVLLSDPGRIMPADAHAVVRLTLKDLSARIGGAMTRGGDNIDLATRAHLDEAKTRIDRALDAEFQL